MMTAERQKAITQLQKAIDLLQEELKLGKENLRQDFNDAFLQRWMQVLEQLSAAAKAGMELKDLAKELGLGRALTDSFRNDSKVIDATYDALQACRRVK